MDFTITIDEKILLRAQELAQRQGTSVNQIIRELLVKWTLGQSSDSGLRELEEMWAKGQASPEIGSGTGKSFMTGIEVVNPFRPV